MSRRSPSLPLLALGFASVFVVGCPGKSEDPAASSAAQQRPAELPEPPPPVPPDTDQADERRTNDALAVAANAAETVARGSDECVNAHTQLSAMLRSIETELDQQVHIPVREPFVEVCREMTPEARRCIVPTYAMEHHDACAEALSALPDDLRQRFAAVVNGPDSN